MELQELEKNKKGGKSGSGIRELLKLYRFLKPYRWKFALGMSFLLISSGASLMFPKYLGNMVDLGNKGEMISEISQTGLILLAIILIQAVFSYSRIRIFVEVTEKTLASIRQHLYNHLIKLPMSFFAVQRVGELNSRISSDISLLQDSLTSTLADLLSQLILIIGGITLMTISSFKLTMFMLAILPAVALFAFFSGRAIRRYSRKENVVLGNVSFKVEPGQQVALVGPSGAGKSTIVSLLLKFYEPVKGDILFDGRNGRSIPITALRAQMAIVPQDVFLFGGTIRENIAYGKPGSATDEIIEAAKQANAWDFIQSFPEKLDTIVGERGIQLSGGQRQRIAIARAVLKNPKILILDEATSSLDSESERLVQEALDKLMKGRTSVVIAHRLATIRNADKIIVLENGTIIEQGTHNELLANKNGLYKTLTELQFGV